MKSIYFDNAATTPMLPEVIEVVTSAMGNLTGNPSSIHSKGRSTRAQIELARKQIAKVINAQSSEIIFTSGGTEADNLAIKGAVNDLGVQRIITSKIEHHAVLHTVEHLLKDNSIVVEYVSHLENGDVDLDHLNKLLKSDSKTLVSLMHVNNEIGNVLNLKTVSELCKVNQAYFHSDTVQSIGYFPIDVKQLGIDFITCSAHKFHGPKGCGFLYINKQHTLQPLINGGAQERGIRSGTENVFGILGLAKALTIAHKDNAQICKDVLSLKSYMIEALDKENIPYSINGNYENSSPAILNVTFNFEKDSSMMLFNLDLAGIAISGGSACTSGSNLGSHVLSELNTNMNMPAIRFSFSKLNTIEEINDTVDILKKLIVT